VRKAIFLGDHAEYIEGMDYEDGRALIEELNVLVTPRDAVYSHKWKRASAWSGTTAAFCIGRPVSTWHGTAASCAAAPSTEISLIERQLSSELSGEMTGYDVAGLLT
jgi:hypothetical protein